LSLSRTLRTKSKIIFAHIFVKSGWIYIEPTYQDQNDLRPVLRISSNTFHQRKRLIVRFCLLFGKTFFCSQLRNETPIFHLAWHSDNRLLCVSCCTIAKIVVVSELLPLDGAEVLIGVSVFAGEMYSTICVKRAENHFCVGLMRICPLFTKICAKMILHFATADLRTDRKTDRVQHLMWSHRQGRIIHKTYTKMNTEHVTHWGRAGSGSGRYVHLTLAAWCC